jgi:hypothetical protein
LIRKQIFPTLAKREGYRLLRLIAVLIWSVALAGIGAWVWTSQPVTAQPASTSGTTITTHGPGSPIVSGTRGDVDLTIGNPPDAAR